MRPQTTDHRPRSTAESWRRRVFRVCGLSSVVCGLSLAAGCLHRSLTIRTEPPGAKVYVNDELKGVSPVSYDFVWYGWYRLTLRKDGYQRLDDQRELRCSPFLWIPFDLAAELLPLPIRDARTWSYTLTPAPTLPTPKPPETTPVKTSTPPSTTESSHAAR